MGFDEDETYGGTFKGEYTGNVEFTVASTQSASARRSAGKGFSLHRGATAPRAAAPSGLSRTAGQGRKAAAKAPVRRELAQPKAK